MWCFIYYKDAISFKLEFLDQAIYFQNRILEWNSSFSFQYVNIGYSDYFEALSTITNLF